MANNKDCFPLLFYIDMLTYVHPEIKRLMLEPTALYPVRQLSFRNMVSFVHEFLVREFTKFTTMRTTRKISINDGIVLE